MFPACKRYTCMTKSKSSMAPPDETQRKKKESIVELSKFIDKRIRVKFQGGREATGILKGYDALLNLVLDDTQEFLRDPDDLLKITDETRSLGLVVARGTAVTVIAPNEGVEQIANPTNNNATISLWYFVCGFRVSVDFQCYNKRILIVEMQFMDIRPKHKMSLKSHCLCKVDVVSTLTTTFCEQFILENVHRTNKF
ncbi:Sm domain-containing protein [Aphelenchoides besseyi]|nr:Sm domain-containing protein [Aphelenchoides besseyi]